MLGSLNAMDRGAVRLGRVIDDLLLLSKVGDPNYPMIPVPVDLHRVLDEVLDLSSVAAQRKALEIRVEAPDRPLLAMGDPEELDRICANLVSNAIKYTPDGRSITVSLSSEDDQVVLRSPTRASASRRPTSSTCSASSSARPTRRPSPSPAPAWG